MNILTFDTETSGKCDFKAAPNAPGQPRLVQLGAILSDENGRVFGEINLIVKPEGFEIPVEASNIHGITTEIALKYGLKLQTVLGMFKTFLDRADLLVAHNFDYDKLVMRGEYIRNAMVEVSDRIATGKSYCTMKASTDILQLPGPYGNKWPKLTEAYKYFFNEELEGAHDAMADVRGCSRVYYHLASMKELDLTGKA